MIQSCVDALNECQIESVKIPIHVAVYRSHATKSISYKTKFNPNNNNCFKYVGYKDKINDS